MAHPTLRSSEHKLRTACDKCQASKVKCSRGKPSCWRCSQDGVACVYSPLRRTGRPPRRISTPTHTGESINGASKSTSHQQNHGTQKPTNQQHVRQAEENGVYSSWAKPAPIDPGTSSAQVDVLNTDLAPNGGKQWEARPMTSQTNTVNSLIQDLMLNFDTCGFTMEGISPGFDMALGGSTLIPNTSRFGTGGNSTTHTGLPTLADMTRTSGASGRRVFEGGGWDIPSYNRYSSTAPTVFPLSPSMAGDSGYNRRLSPNVAKISERKDSVSSDTTFPFSSFFSPHTGAASTSGIPLTGVYTGNRISQSRDGQTCPYGGTCYKALSDILTRLLEYDSDTDGQDSIPLDTLLCLDREFQETAWKTLDCRYCMERSSNQNTIMIVYMSLDSLLHLFEKQQKRQQQSEQTDLSRRKESITPEKHRPSMQMSQDTAARRASIAGPSPKDGQEQQQQDLKTSRLLGRFPWTDKSLLIGSFAVDNAVKASFLRFLVLGYVDNMLMILSELEKEASVIMKGVNCNIVKDKAVDIHRRAFFLRGILRLDTVSM